jgi:methyl-accepting chemotaxis protein
MNTQVAESKHIHKINIIFSWVLLVHVLVAMGFAAVYGTDISFAFIASLAICSLPVGLRYFSKLHTLTAVAHGASLMMFSSLLIHLSKGIIETHFHIFVMLASLILYASPLVILAATISAAVQHVGFFLLLPSSMFNYQASFWVVVIHAAYVVVQTIPCLWISKKFGDYIIRQGVIVQQIDEMYTSMKRMIEDVKEINLAIGTDTVLQTESVARTAEAIHEINLMVNTTSTNAEDSSQISKQTKQAASEGINAMKQLSDAIVAIKSTNQQMYSQVDDSNKQLAEIVETIKKIESKTHVINDIVFQTKLLSFNASVESARSGEHGKGFAVVAEEIGNLAAMSGKASKEINELINLSVQRVTEIAATTKTRLSQMSASAKHSIEEGEVKTNLTSKRFDEMNQYLDGLVSRVSEISTSTQEQALGVDRIMQSIKQLEQVNDRAAKAQGVSKKFSDDLGHVSDEMGRLVVGLVKS